MRKALSISIAILVLLAGLPFISFESEAGTASGTVMGLMNPDPIYGVQGTDTGTDRNFNVTAINVGPITCNYPVAYQGNTVGSGWTESATDYFTWYPGSQWGSNGDTADHVLMVLESPLGGTTNDCDGGTPTDGNPYGNMTCAIFTEYNMGFNAFVDITKYATPQMIPTPQSDGGIGAGGIIPIKWPRVTDVNYSTLWSGYTICW